MRNTRGEPIPRTLHRPDYECNYPTPIKPSELRKRLVDTGVAGIVLNLEPVTRIGYGGWFTYFDNLTFSKPNVWLLTGVTPVIET